MGDEADDEAALSDGEREQYDKVKDAFELYFLTRKNVIYERARFNPRVQQANKTVDFFITFLYTQA